MRVGRGGISRPTRRTSNGKIPSTRFLPWLGGDDGLTGDDRREIEAVPMTFDEVFHEVVGGQRVEMPLPSVHACLIASRLAMKIETFASAREFGRAIPWTLFRLSTSPDLQRRPGAAYISFDRWPRSRGLPTIDPWDVVPDLVVEVVSATNYAEEIPTKSREYFEAGVRRAWVIYPHESLVTSTIPLERSGCWAGKTPWREGRPSWASGSPWPTSSREPEGPISPDLIKARRPGGTSPPGLRVVFGGGSSPDRLSRRRCRTGRG